MYSHVINFKLITSMALLLVFFWELDDIKHIKD